MSWRSGEHRPETIQEGVEVKLKSGRGPSLKAASDSSRCKETKDSSPGDEGRREELVQESWMCHYLHHGSGVTRCMHMSELIRLYILNVYS